MNTAQTIPVIGFAGALALIAACELPWAIECTTDARPALRVEVVDSLTGALLAEPLVWVRDGSFQDTLEVSFGRASGPHERPGTYEVHVEHDGYEPWVRASVRVSEDECHVQTRSLTARLQPRAAEGEHARAVSSTSFPAYSFGRVTPCCPWYLPFLSL